MMGLPLASRLDHVFEESQARKVTPRTCVQDIAGMWQGVTERNFRHPLRIATAIEYMSEAREIINAPEDASCQLPELPSFAEEENYDFECPEDYERAATGELACVPVEEEEE